MKKLLSFVVVLVMLVGVIPMSVMAEDTDIVPGIVFYDNNDNVISTIDGVESVYAKITFDAADGFATIIASTYDSTGRFTGVKFVDENATSPYTTQSVSVNDAELVKFFAFEDMTTMKPLLPRAGALAEAPTASVQSLDVTEIAKDADIALSSALNFKADESTKVQLEAYGDWYADFVLTINKDVTLNANGTADGYLAGQYDSWSKYWVKVPTKETVLRAGEPFRVMATGAEQLGKKGLKYTYREVYEIVKDFDCGVYFDTDFIKANPGLKATLSLRMFNPQNEAEYYVVGDEYSFDYTLPDATVERLSVSDIVKAEGGVELSTAVNFKADEVNAQQLDAYGNWYTDFVLTVNKDIVLNADGSESGYLAGQYDSWSKAWVKIPTKRTELKADEPMKIMATGAEMLGKPGLKYTYREVYEFVKDFNCGIYFETDFIKANPGFKATLSLCMFNPIDETDFVLIGEQQVFDYTLPEATVTPLDVEEIKTEAGIDLSSALNFAADVVTPEQLGAYSEWYTDFVITVNKDVTFNATGEGANGYLAGQYDAYSANWLKVPTTAVTVSANDSIKIMETAAELLGKKGLKYTYEEVYAIVKDFNCGIYFNDEFLIENADLAVTLELRLYNPANQEEYIVIGNSYDFQFEPKAINKFTANDNLNIKHGIDGTVEVKLGQIFAPVEGANISSADLTLSINGDNCEYIKNEDDWTQSTLKFTGAGQVHFVINDNHNCYDAFATVTITEPEKTEKFDKKFNKDFLYRVGNENNVAVSSLFSAKEGADIRTVEVTVDPVDGTGATGAYDKESDSIDFNGTGIVKVTITDNAYCIPTELYLEVVTATNITSATGTTTGGDFVLLNDVTASGYVNYWNSTLYGNGFTYDITNSSKTNHTYNSKQGHGLIIAKNAIIDNLVVTGAVYSGYGAYSTQDYYNAAIASENSTIQNCYISNCSTPIRAMGSTTVKNTTLYGGSVANMYINSGATILENVTTVNFNDGRNTLGLGIVVGTDATDSTELFLEGSLKQYNFIKDSDKSSISDQFGKIVIDSMFGSEFNSYKFTVGNDTYINSGIVAMKDGFNISKIHDNANTGYVGNVAKMNTGTSTVNGYVYTQPNTSGTVDNGYSTENDAHISAVQGVCKPVFHYVLGAQAKEIDADTYIRQASTDDTIKVQYKEGETPLTLDITKLVSMTRYDGVSHTINAQCIAPDGSVLTANNGVVTLNQSGDYTLKFTVQDDYIYDNDGNKTGSSVVWTYENTLSVNIKAPEAKNAEVSIINTSLDGVYTTVNLTDYKLRINFLEAISIKDYKNAASSAETVSLTSNIKSATLTPANVNVFTTASTVTIEYNDGRKLVVELSRISGSSAGTKTAKVNTSGSVYFITDGALDNKPTDASNQNKCTITSVSFIGYSGEEVKKDTDVTVTWALGSSSGGGTDTCLAEGTLITLADGSKRAVEDLRKGDKVMVYDHLNGNLTSSDVIIVVKTSSDMYYKNTFVFDDGTTLATINEHGIYDLDLCKYVNIDHLNYSEFIGHRFVSVDSKGNIGFKTLVDVLCEVSSGYKYDIVTDGTLNYVAEDTLSVTHVLVDVINSFDFAEDMTYDKEKMNADIEKYGLYSYDEWSDYCDISVFNEYNIPVMKVGISKGMYTKEYIIGLINTYVLDDSVQIID